MEAMAELTQIQTLRLPGTLGIYEEYANDVAQAIQSIL